MAFHLLHTYRTSGNIQTQWAIDIMEVPDTACRTMSQMSVHSDSNSLPSENNSNFQDIIEVTLMNSTEHESNYNDHEYMCSDGAKGKWFEIL